MTYNVFGGTLNLALSLTQPCRTVNERPAFDTARKVLVYYCPIWPMITVRSVKVK